MRIFFLYFRLLPAFAVLLSFALPPASAQAQVPAANSGEITAEEIVEMVHISRALRKHALQGVLDKNGKEVPFSVRMNANLIEFTFANPGQTITLDINDKGAKLSESSGRSRPKPVPAGRYSEGIRGTDLTYDDISFRYLYWPRKIKQPHEEIIKTMKCYVVDLHNPDQNGEYGVVRIFVDKKSGALMRIRGYDRQQRTIKECSVTSGMKVDGAMALKEMDVNRHDPVTGRVIGETTFELKRPG